MSSNKQSKSALNGIKMQAANEVGVPLNNGYNGELTARQAGSIGGQMVKKMIESYEQQEQQQNSQNTMQNNTQGTQGVSQNSMQ